MSPADTTTLFDRMHLCLRLIHRSQHVCQGHGKGGYRGQGRLLALLGEKDGISQRELAERLHIRPPSLSELLFKLETGGLVERRQSENDRRVSQVYLTESGRLAASHFGQARCARLDGALSGLTEEEQKSLLALLDKCIAGLESRMDESVTGQGGKNGHRHARPDGICACGQHQSHGADTGSMRHHACGGNGHNHAHHCCGGGKGRKHKEPLINPASFDEGQGAPHAKKRDISRR